MPDQEHLVLEPISLVAGGDALARREDGKVVFVRGALPGEVVEARVVERKKDFARAEVAAVLRPSPLRVVPPCPFVARGCGGCDLQHLAAGAQAAQKAEIVTDALRRIGRLPEPRVMLGPPLPAEGFRTTVRAAIRDGRAGFRRGRSHDVLVVDRCLVAHPLIDEMLVEGRFGAEAREVTLRVGANTGERLALVHPTAEGTRLPDDVLVVGADDLDRGRRAWIHDQVDGTSFRISAASFFQSRTDGAAALADVVRSAIGPALAPGATLVDAYAGVGLFAASLASPSSVPEERAVRAVALERSPSSLADARVNLADHHASLVSVDVDRWKPTAADVVVADPARPGLGAAAAGRLAGTGAPILVLVSCDAAALARDVRLLGGHGFHHRESVLVDLFPHTHHVEVVSTLTRERNS